ncbi:MULTISPECIES: hypothetical protein [Amycolatopsis]|uniref:hypothetical protein n=1 Tax=Amycolatopsis TaxID=1813 RepID=UPI001C58A4BF|nr:hypothetical protein [Amycolatopsis sp. TNS106]QXV60676.1 hypothetical protein CVV72_29240 [Amycolatopsis sp. TNS106]
MADDQLVISRTPGVVGHLVLVVLFATLTVVMTIAVVSDYQLAVRIVAGVLCAVFIYCGTIEFRNYRTPPPADELIFDPAGIRRIKGGVVAWSARWENIAQVILSLEFREYSPHRSAPDEFKLVIRPGEGFDALDAGFAREPDGDLQVADVDLRPRDVERLLPFLVKRVDVALEDDNTAVRPVPDEPVVETAREEALDVVDDVVKIHVNGWDKRKLWVFRFVSLMIEVTALVVAAATEGTAVRAGALGVLFALFAVTMVVEGLEGGTHDKKRKVVLELRPRGFYFRTYGTFVGVWWHEIDAVRWGVDHGSTYLDFLPGSDMFAIRHPQLAELTRSNPYDAGSGSLAGGWYRLARPFSVNARREFESSMRRSERVEFREAAASR